MTMPDPVRAPWCLKPANRLYRVLLRRGVSIGREHSVVLTVPGRKSGRPRSTPVTPMHVDGRRYVGEQVPAGVGFLKRSGIVTDGTADEVEGLAGRLPVFRIDPIT
jgi:hypothetical protein